MKENIYVKIANLLKSIKKKMHLFFLKIKRKIFPKKMTKKDEELLSVIDEFEGKKDQYNLAAIFDRKEIIAMGAV